MASNLELECPPDEEIQYGPCLDAHTHRPRTPNIPYSELTEQQERNIQKNPAAFFMNSGASSDSGSSADGTRHYKERYVNSTSEHLFRPPYLSNPYCWIDEKRTRDAGTLDETRVGEKTLAHFDSEDPKMFLKVDTYHRPPTNQPGPIIMKYGRPNDGYYSQRNPQSTTWFGSSHVLNQTRILQNIEPHSLAEYQTEEEMRRTKMGTRIGKYPELSEYQDRYELNSHQPANLHS